MTSFHRIFDMALNLPDGTGDGENAERIDEKIREESQAANDKKTT
jgi:hypothetical protein